MKKTYLATAVAALFVSPITTAIAADALLDDVVVSVNKYEQRAFDTAASVNVINKNKIQDQQSQNNLSETMSEVPGLYALNRQNYAQDVMISSRGFGSNSAFGARGIKIYVDGVPATLADGQGQTGHIDLASAEKIEILRGPFTSIYGNSAGGVIHVFTESGQPGTQITPYASYGSFGTSKLGVKAGGDNGSVNYLIDANHLNSDGSRGHSETGRSIENGKIRFSLGGDSELTLIGNRMSLTANDPLGLLSSDVANKSQTAGYNADYWNSRKMVTQNQGGFQFLKKLQGSDEIKVLGYIGDRQQEQYLAPGTSSKLYRLDGTLGKNSTELGFDIATNIRYNGGQIALDRNFYGIDGQYNKSVSILNIKSRMVAGISYDRVSDRSTSACLKNIAGAVSAIDCGVSSGSSLNTDANYGSYAFDQYLKIESYVTDRVTVNAGIRHANVNISASDNFGSFASAERKYSAILPMGSLNFAVNPMTNMYVSIGSGLDTPTTNQIKYSCTASPCSTTNLVATPNMLDPSKTNQIEVGIKQAIPSLIRWTLAIFQSNTNKEIMSLANLAGKNVYTNANDTQRKGVEWHSIIDLSNNLKSTISYTYLVAKVTESYSLGGVNTISSGSYIPGVPKQKFFADLAWKKTDQSIELGVEMIASSSLYANDTNTAQSAGYGLFNLRAGLRQKYNNLTLTQFARLNNISDKYYVGSVIVNQKDNFFYEPSPGRNWVVGAKATYAF